MEIPHTLPHLFLTLICPSDRQKPQLSANSTLSCNRPPSPISAYLMTG
uniref:Uncharacterized protein n=1 Tax=Anguilla anguilla TaxID=7936 RepID=A0A0E9UH97_ANGAN